MSRDDLPSWRSCVGDEFREQNGVVAKAWWVTRFALAVLTLGNADFGVAAMGSGGAQADRAIRKARAATRRDVDDVKR
jgi:hypothetical protein